LKRASHQRNQNGVQHSGSVAGEATRHTIIGRKR
jgi:hypothetical protein